MSLNEYQQFEESINARIRLLESEKLDLVARFKKAASKRDMVQCRMIDQERSLKDLELRRLAAMAVASMQQAANMRMAKFTSDFVTLSKKAGKVKGVTEKEANAALSMATTKINNVNIVGESIADFTNDSLEETELSTAVIDGGGDEIESMFARFGLDAAEKEEAVPVTLPSALAALPDVPTHRIEKKGSLHALQNNF